ncbi:MAG TPA: PHB depolymerase family esterase [Blastocatellia bacterium]|nr:PHB depolymerase family esterase [Blastocatellia bacterium]
MRKDHNKLAHRWLGLSLASAMLGPTMFGSPSEAHPMTLTQQAMIQTITVPYEGVDRSVSLYVPTGYRAGTAVPLVFALHGGGGDASIMYAPDHRIVEYAEREGFIAVFPNGLPRPDAPPNSTNYYWHDPVNIGYMNHLIDLMIARYTVDTHRIYFIGFSGGAQLSYKLAADPQISARIAAIATAAGSIGSKFTDPPTSPWEIIDPSASGGRPLSALLLQGGNDRKLPAEGGFPEDYNEIQLSFQVKVDIFRLFLGATMSSRFTHPLLPSRAQAMAYTNPTTRQAVISILDPVLGHAWPDWNYMGIIWDFFQRVPTR